jgi:hypothetical protein
MCKSTKCTKNGLVFTLQFQTELITVPKSNFTNLNIAADTVPYNETFNHLIIKRN